MTSAVLVIVLGAGRIAVALPALIGMLICLVAISGPTVSTQTILLFLFSVCIVPAVLLVAVAGLSQVSELEDVPSSWGAAVAVAGFLLLFQSDFFFDLLSFIAAGQGLSPVGLLAGGTQLLSRAVWVSSALVFLFAGLVLLIELPFIWLLRVNGISTPALLNVYRPLFLFIAAALSVDLIASFTIQELNVSAFLTR